MADVDLSPSIDDALHQLTDDQRAVIIAIDVEGRPLAEVARRSTCPSAPSKAAVRGPGPGSPGCLPHLVSGHGRRRDHRCTRTPTHLSSPCLPSRSTYSRTCTRVRRRRHRGARPRASRRRRERRPRGAGPHRRRSGGVARVPAATAPDDVLTRPRATLRVPTAQRLGGLDRRGACGAGARGGRHGDGRRRGRHHGGGAEYRFRTRIGRRIPSRCPRPNVRRCCRLFGPQSFAATDCARIQGRNGQVPLNCQMGC